ncbi:MAG: tricarballylate dehydrogenase, partial [Alphaproteobacteria bacterium]
MAKEQTCDVIVIGGGSAAFEAAVSAKKSGADHVIMLEKAPEAEYGGNARFSGTGFRFTHEGAAEMRELVPDVDEEYYRSLNINPYTRDDFLADLDRMTQGCMDRELA